MRKPKVDTRSESVDKVKDANDKLRAENRKLKKDIKLLKKENGQLRKELTKEISFNENFSSEEPESIIEPTIAEKSLTCSTCGSHEIKVVPAGQFEIHICENGHKKRKKALTD